MAFSLQQHLNFLWKGSSGWKKSWTRKLHFWVLFGPRARAARVHSERCSPGLFSSCWTVSKEILFYALWWQKCMLPIDLVFPPFPVLKTCKHECVVVVWFMFSSFSLLLFALQWMFLFCFVYVIVLYFPNFLYVSFWFFVFYPISLFDFFGCLFLTFIDVSSIPFSLPCSLLRILIFLFVFLPSLILSLSFTTTLFFVAFTQDWKVPKINRSVQKNGRTAEYPNNRSRTNEQMQRWKHPFGVEKLKQTLGVKRGLYETATYGVDINDQKKTKNINKWHWHHQKPRICVKKHWNIWKIKGLFAFFPSSRALESSDSPPWVTTSPLPSSGVFNSATCMGFQNGWRKQQTITIKAIAVDPLLQRWQPSAFKFYCWYISVMSKLCRQRNHNKFSRRQRKNIRLHHVKTFSVAQMLLQSCSAMMVSQAP